MHLTNKEVFKHCKDILNIDVCEITDDYTDAFLDSAKYKIIYCASDSYLVESIQSEFEQMFPSYKITSECRISKWCKFPENNSNVLITQASFLLTYLRQGLLHLNDVDYLIFEAKKLKFCEDNCIETIIKEFFVPVFNMGSFSLPKIFILNLFTDEYKIDKSDVNQTMKEMGISEPSFIQMISIHSYQVFCDKLIERDGIIGRRTLKDMRILQIFCLLLRDIITTKCNNTFDAKSYFTLKSLQPIYDSSINFFNKPNYLNIENMCYQGNIILDLFQFSLMDKKNLQNRNYISKPLYKLLTETAKSEELGIKLNCINEKILSNNCELFKNLACSLIDIFSNDRNSQNLLSKFLNILEGVFHQNVLAEDDSNSSQKISFPFSVQYMIILSVSIYLHGDSILNLHNKTKDDVKDLSDSFIDLISCIEKMFTESIKSEEIEQIKEISSYWRELYCKLFNLLQEEQISFECEKTKILEDKINQELNNNSQVLILVEDSFDAYLIEKLLRKRIDPNDNCRVPLTKLVYKISSGTETNETDMYAQPTHHDSSEIDQQIYNFKSKLKNELKNFEGNVDPYLDAIKLIVNGEILSDDDESYADSLYNFESGKSQVLISKAFSNAMIKRQNISIILFNENSFAKVPIESSVLLNKTKIIFVHDLREETLNKIRKFDKNISSRYTARKKNELKFYELQNISMKENSQMHHIKRKCNSVVKVKWESAVEVFQNQILCNLTNNYPDSTFSINRCGLELIKNYKALISFNDKKIQKTALYPNNLIVSGLVVELIKVFSEIQLDEEPIIDGIRLIESNHRLDKKNITPSIKDEISDLSIESSWNDVEIPVIQYETQLEPTDPTFRQGSITIYYDSKKTERTQEWGVISDTKLFFPRRIKCSLPTWEYFDDRKNNK